MGSDFFRALEGVAVLLGTVAIISVLVSKNAQTGAVIQDTASGFSNALGVAISPVTGNSYQLNLGYAGAGPFD